MKTNQKKLNRTTKIERKKNTKLVVDKFTKKTNNLPIKSKSKNTTSLTSAKQKELKKLVSAYQQVGVSLTKLFKPTK